MVEPAPSRRQAFTLLEVALIVAIIGMMLMMVVGYLFAPKPRVAPPKQVAPASPPSTMTPAPLPTVPAPFTTIRATPPPVTPAATPAPPEAATPLPKPQFR